MQTFRNSRPALCGLLLILFLCSARVLLAQPGSIDASFTPQLNAGAQIYVVAIQPDGQILVGGQFDSIGNVPIANVARLNPDGSLDGTFNPSYAADQGFVTALVMQSDGKILVGGSFYSSYGLGPNNLVRLNPDGSVDNNFDYGLYLDGPVNAIAVQTDGGIVLAGGFAIVDGYLRRSVARLHGDGTLDYGFDACVASSAGDGGTAVALQPDNRILATGNFTFTGNRVRNGIARLEICGDLDASYAPQPGVNVGGVAYAFSLLPNANLVLGGSFQNYYAEYMPGVSLLDTNGVPDTTFNPGIGIEQGSAIYVITRQADGKLLLGGNFTAFDGSSKPGITRLLANGRPDGSFNAGTGANNSISAIAVQANKRILVAGKFSTFAGQTKNGLVRLMGEPPPPGLDPPLLVGGGWTITLHGQSQSHYSIETSSNLSDWLPWTNFTSTASSTTFSDTTATSARRRFYRAALLP